MKIGGLELKKSLNCIFKDKVKREKTTKCLEEMYLNIQKTSICNYLADPNTEKQMAKNKRCANGTLMMGEL